MSNTRNYKKIFCVSAVIRRIITAWLVAATVESCLACFKSTNLLDLGTISTMSLLRVLALTMALFILFTIYHRDKAERWVIVCAFAVLSALTVFFNYTLPFLIACIVVLGLLLVYAFCGWDHTAAVPGRSCGYTKRWLLIPGIAALLFFSFVSIWTVCRVLTFSTPTFDFGIFSQMFHSMKSSGLPLTTVERDGLLSHFCVHVSPIYYLLLPFYCLFPTPATLQVLQAAVLASAVIPLWLIGRQNKLHPGLCAVLCILLLLYPAYSGGTSYDIHENAFLAPLILWLFYGFDKKNGLLTALFAVLVLMVKEDAAVYVAVIALYYLLRGLLRKDRFETVFGMIIALAAIAWFIAVTNYLARFGDGVMTYRYKNFMTGNSDSLVSVIKTVLICPMKAIFESVDQEKLKFIGYTLLPIVALPVFTRKYERYLLLIPYVLINLMSDYQYQHDIFFQYTYGSTACLFYMTAINLADFKGDLKKHIALASALCISCVCFISAVIPKASYYPKRYAVNASSYAETREILSLIPDDASVSATTFYTTYLSQRDTLYDVRYGSEDHILSTEYVVLSVSDKDYEETVALLENNGYTIFASQEDVLVIYQKSA